MNGKPVYTIPSKTVLNLESHFRPKLLCDGLTFSTGSACVYNCSFCYVPDMMRKQQPFFQRNGVSGKHADIVIRRANALDILRKQLQSPKARALADKPLVIYSSPAVDVAGNLDLVRETVAACQIILEQTAWDIRLLSKSNLLPKVAEALVAADVSPRASLPGSISADSRRRLPWRDRLIFGVSTGTLDDRLAQAFEEGAPLVSKRIQSLHWLQDHGFRTFGMICPSLPQRNYPLFAMEQAAAIRADHCEHVWAEVINLRGDSFTRTIKCLGDAGYDWEVDQLQKVAADKNAWETYARATFESHAQLYESLAGPDGKPKLRFLQYPGAGTAAWWESQIARGAILL